MDFSIESSTRHLNELPFQSVPAVSMSLLQVELSRLRLCGLIPLILYTYNNKRDINW